jgi:hypothetical protein
VKDFAGYVRWRLSPQGRAAYQTYASGRRDVERVTAGQARPGRGRRLRRTTRAR